MIQNGLHWKLFYLLSLRYSHGLPGTPPAASSFSRLAQPLLTPGLSHRLRIVLNEVLLLIVEGDFMSLSSPLTGSPHRRLELEGGEDEFPLVLSLGLVDDQLGDLRSFLLDFPDRKPVVSGGFF